MELAENVEFWNVVVKRDERMLVGIYVESRLTGENIVSREQMELYKLELSLIGRDLMFASMQPGVDVKNFEDRLRFVRSKLY